MEFGIEECSMLLMKRGKREMTEGIELLNQERIGMFGEKQTSVFDSMSILFMLRFTYVLSPVSYFGVEPLTRFLYLQFPTRQSLLVFCFICVEDRILRVLKIKNIKKSKRHIKIVVAYLQYDRLGVGSWCHLKVFAFL